MLCESGRRKEDGFPQRGHHECFSDCKFQCYRTHLILLTAAEENITKIDWSQWSQNEAEAQTEPFPQTPPVAQHAAKTIIPALRKTHAHVLHEVGVNRIWLFKFPQFPTDEPDEILISYGYIGKTSLLSAAFAFTEMYRNVTRMFRSDRP